MRNSLNPFAPPESKSAVSSGGPNLRGHTLRRKTIIDHRRVESDFRSLAGTLRSASSKLFRTLGIKSGWAFTVDKEAQPDLASLYEKLLEPPGGKSSWHEVVGILELQGTVKGPTLFSGLLGAWMTRDIFEKASLLETPEELVDRMGHDADIFVEDMVEELGKLYPTPSQLRFY